MIHLLVGLIMIQQPALELSSESLAHCTYVTLCAYGQDPDLQGLREDPRVQGTVGFGKAAEVLREAGIYAQPAELSLAELRSWPHPALLRLHTRGDPAQPRIVLLLKVHEDEFTIVDPSRFGRLQPWTVEQVQRRWTGEALLTAPAPIVIPANPWDSLTWGSVVAPVAAIAFVILRRVTTRRRLLTAASVPGALLFFSGCDGTSPERTGSEVEFASSVLDLGTVYIGSTSREVTLCNRGDRVSRIAEVTSSCGCIASGISAGEVIPPNGQREFNMRISISRAGPIDQRINIVFDDGARKTLSIRGVALDGVLAEPPRVTLSIADPGALARAEIQVRSDDGQDFEVLSARAERVRVEHTRGTRVVTVVASFVPGGLVQDTLEITTSHKQRPMLKVPIAVRWVLPWEVRPAVAFVRGGADQFIERDVTVRARHGQPFKVVESKTEDWCVRPKSSDPAVAHMVTIRVRRPTANENPPVRIEVIVPTTMPSGEEIVVPFLFYDSRTTQSTEPLTRK